MKDKLVTFGITKFDKEKLMKPNEDFSLLNKPDNALWASPKLDNEYCISDWENFSGEMSIGWIKKLKFYTEYELLDTAKILTINTTQDYIDIMKNYKRISINHPNKYQLDFIKLRKVFDAIHVTYNAVLTEMRYGVEGYSQYEDFYSYDVDSYMIFNLDCIDKKSIRIYCNSNWTELKDIIKEKEQFDNV